MLCVILYVVFFQFTSQLFQYNLASQSALPAPVFLIQDSGTLLIIQGDGLRYLPLILHSWAEVCHFDKNTSQ